jgi:hypothetical protein
LSPGLAKCPAQLAVLSPEPGHEPVVIIIILHLITFSADLITFSAEKSSVVWSA